MRARARDKNCTILVHVIVGAVFNHQNRPLPYPEVRGLFFLPLASRESQRGQAPDAPSFGGFKCLI
jgi:hypothetical protein